MNTSNDVALGFVDGDSNLDAVFANAGGSPENRACLGDGSGSFACSGVSTDANTSTAVALGSTVVTEPGPGATLENYTCWKVKDLKDPKFTGAVASLVDQFASQSAQIKKPFALCAPTSVNGGSVNNDNDHLCCYKSKGAKFGKQTRPQVRVLGTTLGLQIDLEVSKTVSFCEPCLKTVLP
jgi:hypothetical protein